MKKGKEVEYFDVLSDSDKLNKMLEYSGGRRKVPVIVEDGETVVGFHGKG